MGLGATLAWGAPRVLWMGALIIFVIWIQKYGYGFKYSDSDVSTALSFHYLFMFLAFPVFMTEAILSYRVPLISLGTRSGIKYLHAALHTLAGVFIILGLAFVEKFKVTSTESHFFSLHSWVGITAIALYFGQYVSGLYIYMMSEWAPQAKADFYKVHRYLGAATLLAGFAAILLGIEECQIVYLMSTGLVTFFSSAAYSVGSMLQPLLGYLLLLLAATVMLQYTVFEEQAIPVQSATKAGTV